MTIKTESEIAKFAGNLALTLFSSAVKADPSAPPGQTLYTTAAKAIVLAYLQGVEDTLEDLNAS